MNAIPVKCPYCGEKVTANSGESAALCPKCKKPFALKDAVFAEYAGRFPGNDGFVVRESELVSYTGRSTCPIVPKEIKIIGEGAFRNADITFASLPSKLEDMGPEAFARCKDLESMVCYDGDHSFPTPEDRTKGKIVLPDGLDILRRCAFTGCEKITEVVLPGTMNRIGRSAFSGCVKLKKINLHAGITVLDPGVFFGCTALEEIAIPEGVEKLPDFIFAKCKNLKKVILPKGLKNIGKGAFSGCAKLKYINLPKSLTKLGSNAFDGCSSLEEITLHEIKKESKDSKKETEFTGVKKISASAFAGCTGLKRIKLPDHLKEISKEAFKGCIALEEIFLPAGLESLGEGAFRDCKKLRKIEIPDKITAVPDFLFAGCVNLKTIYLPKDGKKRKGIEKIGAGAFEDCAGLEIIYLPPTLTEIGPDIFNGCTGLEEITIPKKVKIIPDRAFCGCESLKKAVFHSAVFFPKEPCKCKFYSCKCYDCFSELAKNSFKCEKIDPDKSQNPHLLFKDPCGCTFFGCISLEKVTLRSSANIPPFAFFLCNNLKEITFTDNDTEIRCASFDDLKAKMPDTVIGVNAFTGSAFCP